MDALSPGFWVRFDRAVEMFLYYASALLLLAIATLVIGIVVMRYFFALSPIWGEDVPRILFIWMTYLGIAVATKRGQNLRVTFILEKVPPKPRLALELAMHAIVIAMIATIAWHSWPVIQLTLGMRQLSTGWSMAVSFIPFTLAAVLMIVYTLQLMRKAVRDYQSGHYQAGLTGGGH